MILSQMISMVAGNIDDTTDNETIVGWLNAAKDQMAVEVKASFPDITITSDLSDTFVFDKKYHEIPVLYASAMFKGADGELGSKQDLMNQYYLGLRNFAENYDPPVRYRDDEFTQQFTATDGQTEFTITKNNYNRRYGRLRIYINDVQTEDFDAGYDKTFTLDAGATEGDAVTAVWESYPMFEQKPITWGRW